MSSLIAQSLQTQSVHGLSGAVAPKPVSHRGAMVGLASDPSLSIIRNRLSLYTVALASKPAALNRSSASAVNTPSKAALLSSPPLGASSL